MSKPLQPYNHGIVDYVVGILLLVSPWLFGFADNSYTAMIVMRTMGIILIGLSLLTDYPLGVFKVIPFKTHGIIEAIGAVFLLLSPWIMGYSIIGSATSIAVIVGLLWITVVVMTNYSYHTRSHRMSH